MYIPCFIFLMVTSGNYWSLQPMVKMYTWKMTSGATSLSCILTKVPAKKRISSRYLFCTFYYLAIIRSLMQEQGFQDRCNMSMVLSCKQKTVKDSSLLLLTCALVSHLFIFHPGNLTDLREGTLYPILGIWTAVPISNARCQR